MSEEANSSKNWKKHLLSSSLPLEYEVAKLLVKEGFVVKSDFTFTRKSEGETKEFSVDIKATGYVPFRRPTFKTRLNLLIECKHRSPEKKWIFITEPNEPDFSPFMNATFRDFTRLSAYTKTTKELDEVDREMAGVYKGTEINLSAGGATDADIKSGINQLRYALPDLIANEIWENSFRHPVDCVPFIVSAILVTNAELFVANDGMTVEAVHAASKIEEIATKAENVLLYSQGGPDFERHLNEKVVEFVASGRLKNEGRIFNWREGKESNNGTKKGHAWTQGFHFENFTHFIICSFDAFPKLLKSIKTATQKDTSKSRLLFSKKQIDAFLLEELKKEIVLV
jgi:hypothetical protein